MAAAVGWPDQVVWLGEVQSTMDEARSRAAAGAPHGSTVVATQQTAGRGRSGSNWDSPAGAGLYGTTVLYPPAREEVASVSLVLGLGCAEALLRLGAQVALKWPNDLLGAGGKLGGLLLQRESLGPTGTCLLFGFGINLEAVPATDPWPARPDGATSLPRADLRAALGGASPPPQTVLAAVLGGCEAAYAAWLARGLDADFRRRFDGLHALFGHEAVASRNGGGTVVGRVAGLQPCGGLLLETAAGAEVVRAGAVFAMRAVRPVPPSSAGPA